MSMNVNLISLLNDVENIQDEIDTINTTTGSLNSEVEEIQYEIVSINETLSEQALEIETKQNKITVLDNFTIASIKANTGTIYGALSCATLSLNGSDLATSLSALSSTDASLQNAIDTKLDEISSLNSSKQNNIVSTDNLTCNSINVTKTTPIENDELTSKMYVDNKLAEKQALINSSTSLECNKINTSSATLVSNIIAGFEFVKPAASATRINNTFDGANLLAYNTSTGITGFNGVSAIELRINDIPLHNIRDSGFKIGASTAATEKLDVTGNIIASGSITSSSAIINGVDIGSEVSSLQTQVNGKQDILQAGTNITIDGNNIISSQVSQGDAGPTGPTGSTGPTGINGTIGATGPTGANGINGAVVATGPTGANGTNGTNGAIDATGLQGIQGIQGIQGESGGRTTTIND